MKKDYTKYSFLITLLVIVMLVCISFVPPFQVGDVKLKRANIFSDLYLFDDKEFDNPETIIDESEQDFIEEMNRIENEIILAHDSSSLTISSNQNSLYSDSTNTASIAGSWEVGGKVVENKGDMSKISVGGEEKIVPIEDYYTNSSSSVSISEFCNMLGTETNSRIVRIAFFGDSYIEGDIITADVREQLQTAYGGGGVGFIPFSTPLAQNRPTIKHSYSGWTNYNLLKKTSAPVNIRERFFVSGVVSVPSNGAKSTYTATNFRQHLGTVNTARIIFSNQGNTEISMTINDSINNVFKADSSNVIQQLKITGANINKLRVSIDKPSNFFGYGVVLESGKGISVDNYSIRGNSGLALFGTNTQVNNQINHILGYDLIVIQYGLNVMQAGVNKYTKYGEQLRKIINYVKICFPNSAIIVLGVGDRSTKQDGVFVSMPAVKGMIAEQRAAAQECGVAFWDMCEAMGGPGSMSSYVKKGWAAKDYTHLSFQGGRQIATHFVKALISFKETSISEAIKEREMEDSISLANIYNEMILNDSSNDIFEPIESFDSINFLPLHTPTQDSTTVNSSKNQTDSTIQKVTSVHNTLDSLQHQPNLEDII